MQLTDNFKFWGVVTLIITAFFLVFYNALFPFMVGLIIAYILNPAVNWLENKNINRIIAANLVLFSFIATIILFFLLFIPIISDQLSVFIDNIPYYQHKAVSYFNHFLGTDLKNDFLNHSIDYEKYIKQYAQSALGVTGNVINGVFSNILSFFKNMTFLIIVPIVALYFMIDWNILVSRVNSWLPRKYALTIRNLISEMDHLQSCFIRGQVIVCILQAIFYIITLNFADIDYATTLGFITGILTFIPYIGAGLGFIVISIISLIQYLPDYMPFVWVCIIFSVGQTLEGYVWIPKIVGSSVSLHPLWVMFALLAFGSVWGLSGMLIAVPATAAIGVLTRFALEKYIQSTYYHANNIHHS